VGRTFTRVLWVTFIVSALAAYPAAIMPGEFDGVPFACASIALAAAAGLMLMKWRSRRHEHSSESAMDSITSMLNAVVGSVTSTVMGSAGIRKASGRVPRSSTGPHALPEGLICVESSTTDTQVAFAWRLRYADAAVRVLRSESARASDAEAVLREEHQTRVFEGRGDGFVDRPLRPASTYHYTVFVATGASTWSRPVEVTVQTCEPGVTEGRRLEVT
jgi:hypothetical protein